MNFAKQKTNRNNFANPVRILSASLGQCWGAMGSRAVGLYYKESPGGFPGPGRSQATAGRQRFRDSAGGRSMAGVFCLAREIQLGLAGFQRSRQKHKQRTSARTHFSKRKRSAETALRRKPPDPEKCKNKIREPPRLYKTAEPVET